MFTAITLGSIAGLAIALGIVVIVDRLNAPKRHVCKRKPLAHNQADDGNPDSPMPRVWY